LSLVRCPDGWSGECFYQKHESKSVNPAVTRIVVPEGGGKATYMAANSVSALVALTQWGVLELHPWGSRKPRLDRPDRLIFDFDPDEAVSWDELVSAVGVLRTLLGDLGLTSSSETTGGKGLHVVLPIRATLDWDEAKVRQGRRGFDGANISRSLSRGDVEISPQRQNFHRLLAKRLGRDRDCALFAARGPTRRWPHLSAGTSSPRMSVSITSTYARSRPACSSLKSDPWADFSSCASRSARQCSNESGTRVEPRQAAIGAFSRPLSALDAFLRSTPHETQHPRRQAQNVLGPCQADRPTTAPAVFWSGQ
jgi:bifunctional non-homologous end joining protein LigD